MSVFIENLTNRPVLLRLNSGQTLHLAPRASSREISDIEVSKNLKVQKLQNLHVITLHKVKEEKAKIEIEAEKNN